MRCDLSTWERAEIARSKKDAAALAGTHLHLSFKSQQRYYAPPADTAYSLEYMYYLLGDIRGKQVLDLGCGCGKNTVCLVSRGAHVVAVDISEELVCTARRRFAAHSLSDRAQLVVGSAHALPVADASIDVIFGNAVLHHLDLSRAVIEIDLGNVLGRR